MDEDTIARRDAYLALHQLELIESLGSGNHGIVFLVNGNAKLETAVLKAFFLREPYLREVSVYERLRDLGVTDIRGFEVPQLLDKADEMMVLKITLVSPPFVLDFAGAWLDFPPHFAEEVWEDWEQKNQENFGEDWPMAQIILNDLREMGIHMLDPSPSNIRFR